MSSNDKSSWRFIYYGQSWCALFGFSGHVITVLLEVLFNGNRHIPEIEGAGRNMVKCRPLSCLIASLRVPMIFVLGILTVKMRQYEGLLQ